MKVAVVALTVGGRRMAKKIQQSYPEGVVDVYLPERLLAACEDLITGTDVYSFRGRFGRFFGRLFKEYRFLVCIMAAGIVVRAAAPHLRDKYSDPAVVVMDEKGSFVISLISGHLGGANYLARELAEKIGGQAVVTTATDVRGVPAVEMVARQWNFAPEPRENIKLINSALVSDTEVNFLAEQGLDLPPGFPFKVRVLENTLDNEGFRNRGEKPPEGGHRVMITSLSMKSGLTDFPGSCLLLRPKNIVVGIGCKKGVTAESILESIIKSFAEEGLSQLCLKKLATVEIKRNEEGLLEAARRLDVPLEFIPLEKIESLDAELSCSWFVQKVFGVGGVCEPAAIIASGGGELLWKKKKFGEVTTAAARVISTWWE